MMRDIKYRLFSFITKSLMKVRKNKMDYFCKSHGHKSNEEMRRKCENCANPLKKKIAVVFFIMMMVLHLTACSLQITCKADGCSETDIYEDGYCRYHYYMRAGENLIKDFFN